MTGREYVAAHPNTRRFSASVLPSIKLPDGRRTCRWCGTPIEKKSGRLYWCSDACVEEFKEINDPAHIERKLLERDRGICCDCGVNAQELLNAARGYFPSPDWLERTCPSDMACDLGLPDCYQEGKLIEGKRYASWEYRPEVVEALRSLDWHCAQERFERECAAEDYRRIAIEMGFPDDTSRRWWEADHILEVVRGGGLRGLDNYATRCIPCHKKKTAALAALRAEERALARRLKDHDTSPTLL